MKLCFCEETFPVSIILVNHVQTKHGSSVAEIEKERNAIKIENAQLCEENKQYIW